MNFDRIAPPGTFIHDYMQFMEPQETPEDYDFWCALWLLSVACGRNAVVARPRAPVYLNLYCILVAESGITRKSSAVRFATHVAHALNELDPMMGMLEGKTTPEKLDELIHRRTADTGTGQLAIAVSELATFLGVERYTAAMPALLTDLYDCPAVRRGGGSLGRGAMDQRDVFVSFLSASTPAWLHRSVHPNVTQGGFTSRCMFVVSERPKRRVAWPDDCADDSTRVQHFATRLRGIRDDARRYGAITLNDTARQRFSNWYASRALSRDDFRSSFESREDAHVLRLAALLSVNDNTWLVQHAHIRTAIQCIAAVKTLASGLFAGTGSRSKWFVGVERLRDGLLAAGRDPVPRSKLFLRVRGHMDNAEFASVLDVMHEMGAIQRFVTAHEGAGRPTDLIRGTKLLEARGFIDQLAQAALAA